MLIGRSDGSLRRNNRSESTPAENSEHLGPNFAYAEAVRMFKLPKTLRDVYRTIDRALDSTIDRAILG